MLNVYLTLVCLCLDIGCASGINMTGHDQMSISDELGIRMVSISSNSLPQLEGFKSVWTLQNGRYVGICENILSKLEACIKEMTIFSQHSISSVHKSPTALDELLRDLLRAPRAVLLNSSGLRWMLPFSCSWYSGSVFRLYHYYPDMEQSLHLDTGKSHEPNHANAPDL